MSERRVELIRRALDAFNRGDYRAATQEVHPEVVFFPPGGQPPYRGVDQVRNWMKPDAFAEQATEALEFTSVGDQLVVRQHSKFTGAGSGIEMEFDFWSVWWFDQAGLVTRVAGFLDRNEAVEAAESG